jgi:hypothetical protein
LQPSFRIAMKPALSKPLTRILRSPRAVLAPADDLLDSLAQPLTGQEATLPARACIDRGAPAGGSGSGTRAALCPARVGRRRSRACHNRVMPVRTAWHLSTPSSTSRCGNPRASVISTSWETMTLPRPGPGSFGTGSPAARARPGASRWWAARQGRPHAGPFWDVGSSFPSPGACSWAPTRFRVPPKCSEDSDASRRRHPTRRRNLTADSAREIRLSRELGESSTPQRRPNGSAQRHNRFCIAHAARQLRKRVAPAAPRFRTQAAIARG